MSYLDMLIAVVAFAALFVLFATMPRQKDCAGDCGACHTRGEGSCPTAGGTH